VYRGKGKARRIPQKLILSIDRNRLDGSFEAINATALPDQVKVYFSCSCIQVDGTAKTVTLKPEEGDPLRFPDLLVGADGARSVIREYLAQDLGLQNNAIYRMPISRCFESM